LKEIHTRTDRKKVGGDVQGVRDDQQTDKSHHDVSRSIPEPHGRKLPEPLSGRERCAVANLLDGCHQRKREQGRPEQSESKTRPDLRVGRDPGGVIVRGPRY